MQESPQESAEYRKEWTALLRDQMAERDMARKELRNRLARLGYPVSDATIGYWCRGVCIPKLEHQAAIAKVFGVPHRSLFPAPQVVAA